MPHEATELDTPRLTLVACTPAQLLVLIEHPERFEDVAALTPADGLRGFYVSGEVSPSWLETLRKSAARGADPWRHGFWVVEKSAGEIVGGAGFKGAPDADGMVEIAYGIVPSREGRGYATEAARALIHFAGNEHRVARAVRDGLSHGAPICCGRRSHRQTSPSSGSVTSPTCSKPHFWSTRVDALGSGSVCARISRTRGSFPAK